MVAIIPQLVLIAAQVYPALQKPLGTTTVTPFALLAAALPLVATAAALEARSGSDGVTRDAWSDVGLDKREPASATSDPSGRINWLPCHAADDDEYMSTWRECKAFGYTPTCIAKNQELPDYVIAPPVLYYRLFHADLDAGGCSDECLDSVPNPNHEVRPCKAFTNEWDTDEGSTYHVKITGWISADGKAQACRIRCQTWIKCGC